VIEEDSLYKDWLQEGRTKIPASTYFNGDEYGNYKAEEWASVRFDASVTLVLFYVFHAAYVRTPASSHKLFVPHRLIRFSL